MTETMKRIKKEIEEQKITQTELADRVDVTDVTMHRWLTGKRTPSIKHVERMVKALGLKILIYK